MAERMNNVPTSPAREADDAITSMLRQVALARAAEFARAGDWVRAENLLAELVHGAAPMPAALDLLARMRAQQEHWTEAQQLWTQVERLAPGHAGAEAGLRRLKKEFERRRSGSARRDRPPLATRLVLAVCSVLRKISRRKRSLAEKVAKLSADQQELTKRLDEMTKAKDQRPY